MIHDTASISTMHALAARAWPPNRGCARTVRATWCCLRAYPFFGRKGALALGMGQKQVRKWLRTPNSARPDLHCAGHRRRSRNRIAPCCVVSTVGTTAVTSVDPVAEVQAIAEARPLAPYRCRLRRSGCAAAKCAGCWMGPSAPVRLVVNPQWLFTPIDLSAFYSRKPGGTREAFSLVPSYLRTGQDARPP